MMHKTGLIFSFGKVKRCPNLGRLKIKGNLEREEWGRNLFMEYNGK
ncbi:hypothetical protein P872_15875 [Rhodonellum psychrophilum GCM71 = DSM 17998]|uniref:Uncharacterized protein n=1 Tax=Rhodonellum psychrophilum GCM71 = DSM 17998 TaxID=1123057 RepID=U5BUF4_9BACT|nr:hypothetical protein P872_15875 [Rhodonellum psychrophilum GCM71 = DSM 17998]